MCKPCAIRAVLTVSYNNVTHVHQDLVSPVVVGSELLPNPRSGRAMLFVGNHQLMGLYDMPLLFSELYMVSASAGFTSQFVSTQQLRASVDTNACYDRNLVRSSGMHRRRALSCLTLCSLITEVTHVACCA